MSDYEPSLEHDPQEDPAAGLTWTVGFIGTALLVTSVVGVTALMYAVVDKVQEDTVVAPLTNTVPRELAALREKQNLRLARSAHYELRPENTDGERSIVIPVERAMEIMVRENQ